MISVQSYLTKLFLRSYISLVKRDQWTLEKRRQRYELFRRRFLKAPKNLLCEQVDADGVPAEWLAFPDTSHHRTVLYLHGGGYIMCSIETHRYLIAELARTCNARVLAINYRLAPEHPYPAALQDAIAAYHWLVRHVDNADKIAVIGDSAGAGLAIALLVALRDQHQELPATVVCLCPWVDLTASGESMRTKADEEIIIPVHDIHRAIDFYTAGADPKIPTISPLFADLSGLPPMLIQVGTSEILLDDARRLCQRAKACEVDVELEIWQGMIHVWHFFSVVMPEARQAITRVGQFVKQKIPL